ncbi:MAG: hypothetical protein FJ144_27810 [Deltaproteobacteria bacterium]|nr:hypothetical protein [Deltaproteobacteria bacterium]
MKSGSGSFPTARAALLLVAVVAATVVLTWPLAAHLRTRLPHTDYVARTDALVAGWVLAHQTHALATAPTTIADGNIFHPSSNALFYGPLGVGALPLFAPVFLASGGDTTLALNVTFLLGVALTSWTSAVVVLLWTGSIGAAVASAATLLGSTWLVRGMVATAPFAAALFYVPVIAYRAAFRTRTLRESLWLVPLLFLQCLVDVVYVAPAVLAPLGLLAAGRLLRRATRRSGLHLAAALALSLIAMAPVLAGYVAVAAANPGLPLQTFWDHRIPRFVLPYGLFRDSSRAVPLLLLVFLLVGGVAFLRRKRRSGTEEGDSLWAQGALWTTTGILLSLPPTGFFGRRRIALPIGLAAQWIPSLAVIRTHDRLGVAALFGFAFLAAAAFREVETWIDRIARRRALAVWGRRIALLALVGGLYVASRHQALEEGLWLRPFPLFEPPQWSAPAAEVLRRAPGAVLELPVWPVGISTPFAQARAMYRSTQHWRPLVNGHHSYYPSDFPARVEVAARVPHPKALQALRREANLSTIAVPLDTMPEGMRRQWETLAVSPKPGLRLVFHSQNELIFEIDDVPEPPARP